MKEWTESIQPNLIYQATALSIQKGVSSNTWGIDRIDQRDLPLNQQYQYLDNSNSATVYVIDTGIQINHTGTWHVCRPGIRSGQEQ